MEPILLDIPSELTTPRLRLRVPKFGDGVTVNVSVVESIFELARWMPWAVPTPSADDSEKWVRSAAAKFAAREQFHFLLFDRTTSEHVGTCGIHRLDWKTPWVEIGYWLRTSQVGRGYMTEAVNVVSDFAFQSLKCNRIEIRCDKDNLRSRRVAERAGYALEGILRNAGRDHHNALRDTCIYSRISPAPPSA